MKINKIFLSIIISIAILLAIPMVSNAKTNETVKVNITATDCYKEAYEVLKLVNKERKTAGLNELQMDKDLMEAAMLRADELLLNFDHTRPDNTLCFSVSSKAYGENIAYGFFSSDSVMQAWMNSPGHKANILGNYYTTIGIGAVKYGYTYYWVQLFGIYNLEKVKSIPNNEQKTRSVNVLADKIVPGKVEKVKISSTKDTSLKISWNSVKDAKGYKVYVYDYSKKQYKYYGKTTSTNFNIKGLKSATQYKVRVRAYRDFFGTEYYGKYSDAIKTVTAPKQVNKIKVKSKSKNSVKLNWNKVSGATGYKVYIYNAKTKKYEYYGKTKSKSITIKKLSKNKSYKIKVRAYKTFQGKQYFGENSNVLKVTTLKK